MGWLLVLGLEEGLVECGHCALKVGSYLNGPLRSMVSAEDRSAPNTENRLFIFTLCKQILSNPFGSKNTKAVTLVRRPFKNEVLG